MSGVVFPRIRQLFRGNGHAGHLHAVVLCHIQRKAAPTAPDIQNGHPLLQSELLADELHLVVLGLVQRTGVFPVTATVVHCGTEHTGKHGVVRIVVLFGDHRGPTHALQVEEQLACRDQQRGEIMPYPILQMGTNSLAEHHVQLVAVPPSFKVGFSRPHRPFTEQPFVQVFVMHMNIPRAIAPDTDIRFLKHRNHHFFCIHTLPSFRCSAILVAGEPADDSP